MMLCRSKREISIGPPSIVLSGFNFSRVVLEYMTICAPSTLVFHTVLCSDGDDFEYRGGESGVKYLMRGPSIDWGLILLKPGESMADMPHGHNELDETFYFMEGNGIMVIDGEEYPAPQGTVFLCEPKEMHNIKNNSKKPVKIVFIKGDYKPDDKIE